MEERLQKYLANNGIDSRRKCEQYILEGKVKVNGKTVTELGIKINPEKDEITYNGKKVKMQKRKIYVLLNKPIGYVTTMKEQFNRDKITDLVHTKERLIPVRKIRYVHIRSHNINKRWRFHLQSNTSKK